MRRFRVELEAGEVAGVAFGDPVRPMDVLFLHANGFNGITYQSLLEPLGGQAHVGAMDLRGHGRTTLPANPAKLRSWTRLRDDVVAVLEKSVDETGVVLGGHSMGGTVALLAAAKRPDLVRGLVLVDPVLLPPRVYRLAHMPVLGRLLISSPIAKGARARRRTFESPQHAVDNFSGRGAFQTWRPPFLEDYVVDGVLRQDDGAFGLACAPEWEAACFDAQRNRPWGAIRKLKKKKIPIIVLQAEKNSTAAEDTDERVHAVRPDAAVTRVPGTTHFVPMERPYVVRDALRLVHEATQRGAASVDYVGEVRRTISDAIGKMD